MCLSKSFLRNASSKCPTNVSIICIAGWLADDNLIINFSDDQLIELIVAILVLPREVHFFGEHLLILGLKKVMIFIIFFGHVQVFK